MHTNMGYIYCHVLGGFVLVRVGGNSVDCKFSGRLHFAVLSHMSSVGGRGVYSTALMFGTGFVRSY
jgi:hypothetical protein